MNLRIVKFKDHIPPTLHNAIGTVIGAAIISAISLFKPARDWATFWALFLVPLWIALLPALAVLAIHIFISKRLRAKVANITSSSMRHART